MASRLYEHLYFTKNSHLFLDKLKEISIIDDYILDKSRFGREKIKVESKYNTPEKIQQLLPYLPIDTVIVNETDYPGNEYFLLVGELYLSDFFRLNDEKLIISILTKKEETVRINAWVSFSDLEKISKSDYLFDLTSMNGKIDHETYFSFETKSEWFNDAYEIISIYSSDYIIKDNKLYVKLFLQDFSKVYPKVRTLCDKIEIIDVGDYQ